MRIKPIIVIIIGMILLTGCTSLAEEFARKATELNMTREVVTGSRFQHVLYTKTGRSAKTLHVYLDGDGTPWIAGRPTDDPTPRNPMVLRLMSLDSAHSVYVGRPCYHGLQGTNGCSTRVWLQDRYSKEVVDSLVSVVVKLLDQEGYEKIAWFGHSGGGALAVLLASRFPQTSSIVTVAANLDLVAWSDYTGQDELNTSLNPASLSSLPRQVRQRHYAGAKDAIVPPALMSKAVKHLGSEIIIIGNFDHVCCWENLWPSILEELAEQT